MSEITIQPGGESSMQSFSAANNNVEKIMDKFLSSASVEAVYGSPVQHGERLIIPSAEVLSAAGFGTGIGYGSDQNVSSGGGGGGGGGGGRVLSRPVAVIISGPEGVRVEPVVDLTKVSLAMFTAFGFMAGMAMRMRRAGR
jgi:uncharacterized spore protein YtfJ